MKNKLVPAVATLLLALPSVHAAPFDSLARAMGTAWNAVGAVFSFQYVANTPMVREGILKFLIFILVLKLVQEALKKAGGIFDNKTAGIVGFVVAAVTVIFTPNTFLFSAIIALLIPLALIGWITYYAMMKLKGDWLKNLMGALLMLIVSFITGFTIQMFETWNRFEPRYMEPFVMNVLDIIQGIVMILFIVKLLMILFDGEGGLFRGWGKGHGDGGHGDGGHGDGGHGGGHGDGRDGGGGKHDGDDEEEKEAGEGHATGLDWEHPGTVRFYVTNADDNPIAGADVNVYAVDYGNVSLFRKRPARLMRVYSGKTGPDGMSPTRGLTTAMGSGPIRAKASKGMSSGITETMVLPAHGDHPSVQTIPIQVRGRDEGAQGFQPKIINVYKTGEEDPNDRRLVLEGYIDEERDTQVRRIP